MCLYLWASWSYLVWSSLFVAANLCLQGLQRQDLFSWILAFRSSISLVFFCVSKRKTLFFSVISFWCFFSAVNACCG